MIVIDVYVNYLELLQNSETDNNVFKSTSNLYEYNDNFFYTPKIVGKYFSDINIYPDYKEGTSTFVFDDENIEDITIPASFTNNFFDKINYTNNYIFYTKQSIANKMYYIKFNKNLLKGRYTITTTNDNQNENIDVNNIDVNNIDFDDQKDDKNND